MAEGTAQTFVDDFVACVHHAGIGVALVVTGGGISAVHRLLACPGASRTVLEAEVPYHPAALARYLGAAPGQAVSADTSGRMADRAYARAVRLGQPRGRAAGVACTAALVTDRTRRGEEQAFVAVRTAVARLVFHLRFEKGRSSRAEQEETVGRLVLHALGAGAGLPELEVPMEGVASLVLEQMPCDAPLGDLGAGEGGGVIVIEPDGRVHRDPGSVDVLLAASLNPLHTGHLGMAEAAERLLHRRVDFEVTLLNADKSPIAPPEALARVQCLAWRRRTLATQAPTFVAKARLFPGCCFVVGQDTAVRIVQERFYRGRERMLAALDEVRVRGCRFLVCGRVRDGVFLGLDVVPVPPGYEDLFEEIPERVFREDISSTAVRATRAGN